MPNYFDQFDAPASGGGGNFFDQFDETPSAAWKAETVPAAPASAPLSAYQALSPNESAALNWMAGGTVGQAMPTQTEAVSSESAPSQPMPGVWGALKQGVGSSIRKFSQGAEAAQGKTPTQYEESPAANPFEWAWYPHSSAASKLAFRAGESVPALVGGIVGGAAGGALGEATPLGPVGAAAGTLAGGALGSGVVSAAQSLGPYFSKRLQETPGNPDAAFDAAMRDAEISGAFSGAAWAAFPLKAFSGEAKNLLFQAFGVQPGIGAAAQGVSNVREGKPITQGMGEAYAEGAAMAPILGIGHIGAVGAREFGRGLREGFVPKLSTPEEIDAFLRSMPEAPPQRINPFGDPARAAQTMREQGRLLSSPEALAMQEARKNIYDWSNPTPPKPDVYGPGPRRDLYPDGIVPEAPAPEASQQSQARRNAPLSAPVPPSPDPFDLLPPRPPIPPASAVEATSPAPTVRPAETAATEAPARPAEVAPPTDEGIWAARLAEAPRDADPYALLMGEAPAPQTATEAPGAVQHAQATIVAPAEPPPAAAPALPPIAPSAAVRTRKANGEPLSLLGFLKANGGIKPSTELTALGITPQKFPGLIRKNGKPHDKALGSMIDQGYMGYVDPTAESPFGLPDFYDALDRDLVEGKKTKVGSGEKKAADQRLADENFAEQQRLYAEAEGKLADIDAEHGTPFLQAFEGFHPAAKDEAALRISRGENPDDVVHDLIVREVSDTLSPESSVQSAAHNDFPGWDNEVDTGALRQSGGDTSQAGGVVERPAGQGAHFGISDGGGRNGEAAPVASGQGSGAQGLPKLAREEAARSYPIVLGEGVKPPLKEPRGKYPDLAEIPESEKGGKPAEYDFLFRANQDLFPVQFNYGTDDAGKPLERVGTVHRLGPVSKAEGGGIRAHVFQTGGKISLGKGKGYRDIGPNEKGRWGYFNLTPLGKKGESGAVDPSKQISELDYAPLGTPVVIPANAHRAQPGIEVIHTQIPYAEDAGGKMFALTGWHGSPHEFAPEPGHPAGRFRMDKIGTGEGAQVYSHGLYIGGVEKTGSAYQHNLSANKIRLPGGKVRDLDNPSDVIYLSGDISSAMDKAEADQKIPSDLWRYAGNNANLSALISNTMETVFGGRTPVIEATKGYFLKKSDPEKLIAAGVPKADAEKVAQVYRDAADALDKSGIEQVKGRLYKVEVDVEPDDLMDWDKPVSEQSPKVKAAIEALGFPVDKPLSIKRILKEFDDPASVPESFLEVGIPGLKYLDGNSRSAGEGTHNYVIYDENLIKITAKDGKPVDAQEKADVLRSYAMIGASEGGVLGDSQARTHAMRQLAAGNGFEVPGDVLSAAHEAMQPFVRAIPEGTQFGALASLKPAGPGEYTATFRRPDGSAFDFAVDSEAIFDARAFYSPESGAVVSFRLGSFDLGGDGVHSGAAQGNVPTRLIGGDIAHEVVHANWRNIPVPARAALASHSDSLGILDQFHKGYLQKIGDPSHLDAPDGVTIREIYEDRYSGASPRALDDMMAQEAASHMMELYHHGALTDEQVAPVKDILDGILRGDYARRAEKVVDQTQIQKDDNGGALITSLNQVIDMVDANNGKIYVRWSTGPQHDLKPNARSKDYQSGHYHAGLSANPIESDMDPYQIAKRISEYSYFNSKNSPAKPYFYSAIENGYDSDGTPTITNLKYLGSVHQKYLKIIDDDDFLDAVKARDLADREKKIYQYYEGKPTNKNGWVVEDGWLKYNLADGAKTIAEYEKEFREKTQKVKDRYKIKSLPDLDASTAAAVALNPAKRKPAPVPPEYAKSFALLAPRQSSGNPFLDAIMGGR